MIEKELIGKIRELRQIRPNKDWVVLTKNQILGQEEKKYNFLFFPIFRMAYAGLVVVLILFGLIGVSQNSLPGDLLYPIKKITEQSQAVFVSEKDRPQASLELANKKLEELTKIAQNNQVKNLTPAINEFQVSVSEAAKNLSKIEVSGKDPKVVKTFVDKAKDLKNKAEEIGESFGVVIGNEGLDELKEAATKLELQVIVIMLEDIISRLESTSKMGALTVEQEEMLVQIKELMEEGRYSEALELYLTNQ